MPLFRQTIIETRTIKVEYTVLAKDEDEALGLMEIGSTEDEKEFKGSEEVILRTPVGKPVRYWPPNR